MQLFLQILIKERKKTSAIKKNSPAITKLFEDLAKIGKQLASWQTKTYLASLPSVKYI
jgi:hypothetical protein